MWNKPLAWGLVAAVVALLAITYFSVTDIADDSATSAEFRPEPADAIELEPGIDYVVLEPGEGQVLESDYVTYAMDMYLADGTPVMSSQAQGNYTQPVEMLRSMVPGVAKALTAMKVGETRRYWIEPQNLMPGYPDMANQLHVIDFTLLGGQSALPAPANVDAPPAEAERTASGIAYMVLEEGPAEETAHPTVADTVTVHYTGWQTDGRMFDSSVLRDQPAEFPLGRLIAGWQEAIPLMTRGDKYRFWIPENLAYGKSSRPGAPQGMLVFDVELIDFTSPEPSPAPPAEPPPEEDNAPQ